MNLLFDSLRYLLLSTAACRCTSDMYYKGVPSSGLSMSLLVCFSSLLSSIFSMGFNLTPHLSPVSLKGQAVMLLL